MKSNITINPNMKDTEVINQYVCKSFCKYIFLHLNILIDNICWLIAQKKRMEE